MRSVTVLAPAKLNLALDITGIADNGYHILDMVMQAVNLYETITVRAANDLIIRMPGSTVPINEYNTAYKAALAFFDETGILTGADITVRKEIPIRAGMAGGSADAAGVLVALNKLYNAKLSQEELCKIGLKIGADVPFSILGGTARVQGIGDILLPIHSQLKYWLCVCMPKKGISTRDAYARYDEMGATKHPNCSAMVRDISEGNLLGMLPNVYNVLEETSSSKYNAPIRAILDENKALASMMTGSGAAVFGIFTNRRSASIARSALMREYENIWLLHPISKGVHILEQ
ncbi:MAG: 4-(cytidine 5'-diphospho)-2-C-methyl-D-erythritol kinase [Oscillospiraceae bacterium]